MNEEPDTTAFPLRAWNMGTFVTQWLDICNEAVGVIWSEPGLRSHHDILLVAIYKVHKSNRLVPNGSDINQTFS